MKNLSEDAPFYIVWNQEFIQGKAIIDEQHRGVLATINSLNFFIQQGLDIEFLVPTMNVIMNYIGFHYKTEEGILRATEYPMIAHYVADQNRVDEQLVNVYQKAVKRQEPELVLQFLGDWWQDHMSYHKEVTPYLSEWRGEYCGVNVSHD